MKLKKFIKLLDPICTHFTIWGEDDDKEPLFEGGYFEIPLWLGNFLLLPEEENGGDPPVRFAPYKNDNGVEFTNVIINVMEEG